MLKSVVLCVLLWHEMCQFSSQAHPGSTDTRILNLPPFVPPKINHTDVQIEPRMIYNFNITLTPIFYINGPLFVMSGFNPNLNSTDNVSRAGLSRDEGNRCLKGVTPQAQLSQSSTTASTTESATTESAATESATTESATTESAKTESATTESATTESATTESATTESATSESATTESATSESATTESTTYPRQMEGYSVRKGIGAHKFHLEFETWSEARKICIDEGGDLAVLRSRLEANIVIRMMWDAGMEVAWIGFHNQLGKGNWTSVFDEPLENAWGRWMFPFEVSSDDHPLCMILNADQDTRMIAARCSLPAPFLCKITTV